MSLGADRDTAPIQDVRAEMLKGAQSLAVAAPLLLCNSLSLRQIVESQGGFYFGFLPRWHLFQGPFPQLISFGLFVIAAFAETNRVPFDLPEAENELVAGFHVGVVENEKLPRPY